MIRTMKDKRKVIAFVFVFALVGVVALVISRAATPSVSLEAEGGTLAGCATRSPLTGTDTTASGGASVKFGSSTDCGGPQNCSTASGGNEAFHTSFPVAFCTADGRSVVMSGFNIRNPQIASYTSLEQMQKIRDKGFNVVRIAMQWNQYETSRGVFNEANFTIIRNAIANAKAVGVYVVLDPIHYSGTGLNYDDDGFDKGVSGIIPKWATGTGDEETERIGNNAQAYLQKVATQLGNDPTVVAIDLANEVRPLDYNADAKLITMYNTLSDYVRAVDTDKILMIKGTRGDKLFSVATLASVKYKTNMIYSYHDYYGGGCSGGYASGGWVCGNVTYEDGAGYNLNKAELESHITQNLNRLADPSVRLPVFVGEYGTASGLANADQLRIDKTALFKKYSISRTHWVFYNRGYDEFQGDPPNSDMSATSWGDNGNKPGDWKPWINQIL